MFRNFTSDAVIGVYVDDLLMVAPNDEAMTDLMERLSQLLTISFYDLKRGILGIKITTGVNCIMLDQSALCTKVLQEFDMSSGKYSEKRTLMAPGMVLLEGGVPDRSGFSYRKAIGSLLWLASGTRPDLFYAVNKLSKYLDHPTEAHVKAVKDVMRYMRGTIARGLVFQLNPKSDLVVYADVDNGGCEDSRRSTTGFVAFLRNIPLSFYSKQQPITSNSTTEAEFIATADAAKDGIYLSNILQELEAGSFILYEDNQPAIQRMSNQKITARTKHIALRYAFLRDYVQRGTLEVKCMKSEDNLADGFTKPVTEKIFVRLMSRIKSGDVNV